jgi:uncharacterized protein (TIGR04255 family)
MEAPMPTFSLIPVDEVHLHHAPLAKVLMQVQYSRTPQLVTDEAESAIADALGRYPVRRRQLNVGGFPSVVINGQPVPLPAGAVSSGTVLLFSEPSGAWQVTVTETAVSLETTSYSTRDDFCDRALEIFQALAAVALPPVVDRVGMRYIDRLVGEQLPRVPDYVIPQFHVLCGAIESPLTLHHSVTDSLIEIAETERLQVRSGLLPAGGGFDPSLPLLSEPSWVLDMDVYTVQAGFAFDPGELSQRLQRYAEAAYSFFRFATTDEFQDAHAGQPAPSGQDAR